MARPRPRSAPFGTRCSSRRPWPVPDAHARPCSRWPTTSRWRCGRRRWCTRRLLHLLRPGRQGRAARRAAGRRGLEARLLPRRAGSACSWPALPAAGRLPRRLRRSEVTGMRAPTSRTACTWLAARTLEGLGEQRTLPRALRPRSSEQTVAEVGALSRARPRGGFPKRAPPRRRMRCALPATRAWRSPSQRSCAPSSGAASEMRVSARPEHGLVFYCTCCVNRADLRCRRGKPRRIHVQPGRPGAAARQHPFKLAEVASAPTWATSATTSVAFTILGIAPSTVSTSPSSTVTGPVC